MSIATEAVHANTKGKRMLREAINGYGVDEHTLSEWNAIKKEAELTGKWKWKVNVASVSATVKDRLAKEGQDVVTSLKERFVDVDTAIEEALHSTQPYANRTLKSHEEEGQCNWRDKVGGKMYRCSNETPIKAKQTTVLSKQQRCVWHARECMDVDHNMERSRVIEIPNEYGICLHCYKTKISPVKVPPRIATTKVPGVISMELVRDVKRDLMISQHKGPIHSSPHTQLTAKSVCCWQKEHLENTLVWRCTNHVIVHPTLHNCYLPYCGYHVQRCILEYGTSSCPSIERRNPLGMCRNHFEARLSSLSYESRRTIVLVDTEFDVPGIHECQIDVIHTHAKRHLLAPKHPPSDEYGLGYDSIHGQDQIVVIKSSSPLISPLPIALQVALKSLEQALCTIQRTLQPIFTGMLMAPTIRAIVWRIQFLRRASAVAIRIQRMFRGRRARRRVKALWAEHHALQRVYACRKIQRIAHGYLGRLTFRKEHQALWRAIPHIQRILRGGLARKHCRQLRAILLIQRNYRAYRQRILSTSLREEFAYMRRLQKQADLNLQTLNLQIEAFQRLRARRILRRQMARWKIRRVAKEKETMERLQILLRVIKVQRAYRRHRQYKWIIKRYRSAQCIQKRVRGWLTRHMWRDDPGLLIVCSYISPLTGLKYGKTIVLRQSKRSYAIPTVKMRKASAVIVIQRVFRGHLGRMIANKKWVTMLQRWEWLQLEHTETESDAIATGHAKYGFMLPLHAYNRDPQMHMIPIVHDIKADRGFAYQYQSVLELMADKDGKRAWSLIREQKWKQSRQERERIVQDKINQVDAKKERQARRRALREQEALRAKVREQSLGIGQALFAVGTVVEVATTSAHDKKYHKARIVRVQEVPGLGLGLKSLAASSWGSSSAEPLFDVEYVDCFISIRGVRVYHEQSIPLSRIRQVPEQNMVESTKEFKNDGSHTNVDEVIRSAIAKIKVELIEVHQKKSFEAEKKTNNTQTKRKRPFEMVGMIVDRLRDIRPGHDLLQDPGVFVDFVFQHSGILRGKWLQVLDYVRYGTCTFPSESTISHLTPALLAFYREFGFAIDSDNVRPSVVPMPERAQEMEKRMTLLGFQHDPSGNIQDDERPETVKSKTFPLKDDSLQMEEGSSNNDLHRLLYELKSLPQTSRFDKIIHVTTRNARAFVCGHPACGHCFSSFEAANVHQHAFHQQTTQLTVSKPLVDQYMHAYWPPRSPWNEESSLSGGDDGSRSKQETASLCVNIFRCPHNDIACEHLEFKTQRALQRHLFTVHSQETDKHPGSVVNTPHEIVPVDPIDSTISSTVIWLGAYSICQSQLNDRFGLSTTSKSSSYPAIRMPCRLYNAVAFPAISSVRQEKGIQKMEGYVIFSVEDPGFCPVVRQQKCTQLNQRCHSRAIEQSLICIRLRTLCRDAQNTDWAIGHVFRCCPEVPRNHQHSLCVAADSPEIDDPYEVMLDESCMVAVQLQDICASAAIYQCSKHLFYRKYFHKDDIEAMHFCSKDLSKKGNVQRLTTTIHRFWCGNRTRENMEMQPPSSTEIWE